MLRCRRWARFHVILFAAALATWTIALLSPAPHDSAKKVLGSDWTVFLFGKALHVCSYAALAVLGGTAAAFGRRWVWVLPGLVAHGGLTEFFQQFVGRTARVEDAALDAVGVALGGLLVFGYRMVSLGREAAPSHLE